MQRGGRAPITRLRPDQQRPRRAREDAQTAQRRVRAVLVRDDLEERPVQLEAERRVLQGGGGRCWWRRRRRLLLRRSFGCCRCCGGRGCSIDRHAVLGVGGVLVPSDGFSNFTFLFHGAASSSGLSCLYLRLPLTVRAELPDFGLGDALGP